MSNLFLHKFIRTLALVTTLTCFHQILTAQLAPASTPLADPADSRFQGVQEDWTSPSLTNSKLLPARPLEFVTDTPAYTLELVRLQWRWGDPIDVYVMKPKGVTKPPAILYLYGYPTDTNVFLNEDYQALVTRNGVAAVGFVSALTGPRYHDRSMKEWFVSELQESLGKSSHDVQMVLNYLTTRADLDMSRVGMFAQGSGASIAILASAVDPRIKVLEVLDPWGDWPTWMATSPFVPADERASYVKPEFLKKIAPLDPVEWLPSVQAKKVRLDIQAFDDVTPKAAADKLRAVAPAGTTVDFYPTMKEFTAAFQEGENLVWIQHALQSLPAGSEVPASAGASARTPGFR